MDLPPGESVLCLTTLAAESAGLALGTAQGVVKRVLPDHPSNRDDWEVIGLKDGDAVVGAVELATGEEDLVLIASDGQLLHFSAASVRPQGRPAGGMAGIKLGAGQRVVAFTALDPALESVVVTVVRLVRLPARHGARVGQGHRLLRVPRQGPGDGWRALPPLPQG